MANKFRILLPFFLFLIFIFSFVAKSDTTGQSPELSRKEQLLKKYPITPLPSDESEEEVAESDLKPEFKMKLPPIPQPPKLPAPIIKISDTIGAPETQPEPPPFVRRATIYQ